MGTGVAVSQSSQREESVEPLAQNCNTTLWAWNTTLFTSNVTSAVVSSPKERVMFWEKRLFGMKFKQQ